MKMAIDGARYVLRAGQKKIPVHSFAAASKQFTSWIDSNDLGGSDLAALDGGVYLLGASRPAAWVSYNGKVWSSQAHPAGEAPLFNPYVEGPCPDLRRGPVCDPVHGGRWPLL